MKVQEHYHKPRGTGWPCYLCGEVIDFSKLVEYEYPGSEAKVFASVGFMDSEGDPVKLCAPCRLLAYKRLGQNMADATYSIIQH